MASLPERISADIANHLTDIAGHFKDPKVTLIVRTPGEPDADVILTTDTPEEIRAVLDRTLKPERQGEDAWG